MFADDPNTRGGVLAAAGILALLDAVRRSPIAASRSSPTAST
jgi:hypothetical protein